MSNLQLIYVTCWTPAGLDFCVLTSYPGLPRYAKYGLTRQGVGPCRSATAAWYTREEAERLARAAGPGYKLGEKHDVYRLTQRAIAAADAKRAARDLQPEAAAETAEAESYW